MRYVSAEKWSVLAVKNEDNPPGLGCGALAMIISFLFFFFPSVENIPVIGNFLVFFWYVLILGFIVISYMSDKGGDE